MLVITDNLAIPLQELDFTFSRSSGPGGQNVNKVNTKVTLHWSVESSPNLPEGVRERFLAQFRRRINRQGQLVITSQRFRDQGRNVADCMEKLREMVMSVRFAPKPRKASRPTRASKERRLRSKRANSEKKRGRKPPPGD